MTRVDDQFNMPSHRSAKSCDLNVTNHLDISYPTDTNVMYYE